MRTPSLPCSGFGRLRSSANVHAARDDQSPGIGKRGDTGETREELRRAAGQIPPRVSHVGAEAPGEELVLTQDRGGSERGGPRQDPPTRLSSSRPTCGARRLP
jgi:hypothetical protein